MEQVMRERVRPTRVGGTVVVTLLSALSIAAAVGLGLAARFVMCGVSGCSGGGFGRATDPPLTLTLVIAAGVTLALPLLLYAALRRRGQLALAFVPAVLVGTLVAGLVVGASWNGCPRGVSAATCQEERGH